MNRRQFLKTAGIMALSGKVAYDTFLQLDEKITRHKIYNSLSQYIYTAWHTMIDSEGIEHKQPGVGIFVNKKFYTCAHISHACCEKRFYMPPFGVVSEDIKNIKERHTKVNGKDLEMLVEDIDQDVFIADASKYDFNEFPCKPSSDRRLGDKVFLIGNPKLTGTNIREGVISDLDVFGDINAINHKGKATDFTKYCFGTNIPVISGDSASPIVNSRYELIGLTKVHVNELGYATKIENFVNYKPIIKKEIHNEIKK